MGTKLLKVAWWAILLGLGMEILLVAVAAGVGNMPALKPIVADLVQKVAWSSIVCMGLALGTAASKMRGALMGLAGLVAAPLAFHIARALHKSANQALAIAGPAAGAPSAATLAVVKAVEYALLGMAIAWVSKKGAGVKTYLSVGLVMGAATAVAIVALGASATLGRIVNELVFPVGCSLVLYGAETLGKTKSAA